MIRSASCRRTSPPSPERIAQRACALAAVAGRALLEQEDLASEARLAARRHILAWVQAVGLHDELEPDEWKLLQRAAVPAQDLLLAAWRLEGLAVLAWALRHTALPAYDQPADPCLLLPAVGLLHAPRAKAMLAEPALRPAREIETLAAQTFALHWRLRHYFHRASPLDFPAAARSAGFGPLDPSACRLIDNDLALRGTAIAEAPERVFRACLSIAHERHQAAAWLLVGGSYGQTDTST